PNRPQYLAIWLGLTRVGATVSLLNTNLSGALLAHSIHVVSPRWVIVDADLAGALDAVRSQLDPALRLCAWGAGAHQMERLEQQIAQLPDVPLPQSECVAPSVEDRALYIYTSGTTGLPKAANVSHYRLMQWSHWFAGLMDVKATDRMFNCLPLYHSVGGVVAACAPLVGGASVVLRRRFSASEFWGDVVGHGCTLFQYIGELCRYLVNTPSQALETQHRLRLCCGNGLRPDVWKEFKSRFRIPKILEYYASTEGNFSLYNCEGREGAIGRIPTFLSHRIAVALVRFDVTAGAPVRNEEGRCVRCELDETGEAIGEIVEADGRSASRFEGYADEQASAKKILRDVFSPGDAWYRTGDLMRKDAQGYFYFVDRIGDTFRWKGENVSSAEVAGALASCTGVQEAVVYGVAVPGSDGRAGMAALVVAPEFDLPKFHDDVAARLPEYARPLFVRILAAIEATGTFKPKTHELAAQAYDPAVVADALYFCDRNHQRYVPLDAALFAKLQTAAVRT
ncbi:MAG TPA: long-chain-acyl-CoA synthetase, partial [Burkholderiaceae bacterium]|nr:long-chain-acyl-CoA synthetase [Burkholderiaceae bacterium]